MRGPLSAFPTNMTSDNCWKTSSRKDGESSKVLIARPTTGKKESRKLPRAPGTLRAHAEARNRSDNVSLATVDKGSASRVRSLAKSSRLSSTPGQVSRATANARAISPDSGPLSSMFTRDRHPGGYAKKETLSRLLCDLAQKYNSGP